MPRTVLLTGATGTVSSALLQNLKSSTLDLRAMVRDISRVPQAHVGATEVVAGDLGDPSSLPAAFEGVHDLWLLVPNGPRTPEHTMNALWAARQAGVERVVRLSVVGAAGHAPARGGRLHAMADRLLQDSDLRWTILRPHWFMQNLFDEASEISARGALSMSMGAGRIGMVDVEDVAAVAAAVIDEASDRHDGKTYTLTGPRSVSLADVASSISAALGQRIEYVPVSGATRRATLLSCGVPSWIADMIIEWERAYATGWGDFTTTHVREVLGRSPRDVDDFLHESAGAFSASPPSSSAVELRGTGPRPLRPGALGGPRRGR
jgi:uncharacterized protein YbjT (DUF2867 family)